MRRSGTTTLAQSLGADRCLLVNCDLPATEDMLRDPVLFFRDGERPVVVFDEIHRLSDPTRVLKIAADEFPKLRVVATGSSALEARQAQWPDEPVRYWRDRAGREVDFVRPRARDAVDAYECKGGARAAGESGAGQTIASEPAHPLRAAKPLRRLFQLIWTDCGPRGTPPAFTDSARCKRAYGVRQTNRAGRLGVGDRPSRCGTFVVNVHDARLAGGYGLALKCRTRRPFSAGIRPPGGLLG